MTTYSISAPDGKTYQIEGPAGATQDQVQAEVVRQHPEAVKAAAPAPAEQPPQEQQPAGPPGADPHESFLEHGINMSLSQLFGPTREADIGGLEAVGSLASGAIAAPVAGIAGLASGAVGGDAADTVSSVQDALTYKPKTQSGKTALKVAGYAGEKVAEAADWVGQKNADYYGSPLMGAIANTSVQALPMLLSKAFGGETGSAAEASVKTAMRSAASRQTAANFVNSLGIKFDELPQSTKAMMTSIAADPTNLKHLDPRAVVRVLRAETQGVRTTLGQANRDKSQLTREQNISTTHAGKPVSDIMADQDVALHSRLETLKNTAAPKSKVTTAQETGAPVQSALRRKMQILEGYKNRKYEEARAAGEMELPVDVTPLEEWLKSEPSLTDPEHGIGFLQKRLEHYKQPEETQEAAASSLIDTSTDISKAKTAGPPGEEEAEGPKKSPNITVNDLENIRKELVAKTLGPPSTIGHYAGEAIWQIDKILDRSGGNVYKQARAMHKAVKEEFDRQGMIRKMTGEKGQTTDRQVALEDTLESAVIRGSREDLMKVQRSLLTGGTPETRLRGARAWRDLRAGTLEYLREKAGGKRGIRGEKDQQQFNSTFLDALREIDRDGKLDVLFGDQVAQRVRDFAQTVHDVRTTPATRIAGSPSVANILNTLEGHVSHIPYIGHTLGGTVRAVSKLHDVGKRARDAREAAVDPVRAAAAKAAKAPRQARNKADIRNARLPISVGALQSSAGAGDTGDELP